VLFIWIFSYIFLEPNYLKVSGVWQVDTYKIKRPYFAEGRDLIKPDIQSILSIKCTILISKFPTNAWNSLKPNSASNS